MAVVRGVNVYPTAVEHLLRSHRAVSEFRVTITRHREMAEMLIEIECTDGADSKETIRAVGRTFETSLGLRPEVAMVPQGTLPRFELKAQRFKIV
jgi:phenylacetate-CoA ligase